MTEVTPLETLSDTPHAEVFDTQQPRTVRLQLAAGESVPRHTHPESNVVIHVIEGELTLELDDERHDLDAGEVVRFDGGREVSPRAVTDATALVVLSPKVEE